jgi:hypothetical protein
VAPAHPETTGTHVKVVSDLSTVKVELEVAPKMGDAVEVVELDEG